MTVLLFSLLDNFENGYYLSRALELFWDMIKSLLFQIVSWWIWLLYSGIRFWFECCWELIASALLPFIWPIFFISQLVFGINFSGSAYSENRNSFQKLLPRRKRQLDKYNFSCYWYLSSKKCTFIDQKYDIFNSTYALYSWWVDLNEYKAFASFDSNSETALVDNCANTHIWNVRSQFKIFREISKSRQGVSTIGGQPHFAQGIGDVSTSWRDDNGEIFLHTLKNVLYFPD